ncbi:MAG: M56 family metallopeptidase [Gemmatimonadota bacterium]
MSVVSLALIVAETSLRASVALIVVLGLRRACVGRTDAGVRRALLLAVALAVPALPALGTLLPGVALSPSVLVDLPWTGSTEAMARTSAIPAWLPVWVAAIWALGTTLMLARLTAGLLTVHIRARSGAALRDPAWLADRDRMAAALGLARAPELRLSRDPCMPHAWGFLRPVVMVPASAPGWAASRRRAVLAHELGHLARHEPVARVATELVRAIHWFDPLLRWVVAGFRRESELAADEAAIRLGVDARDYADNLLNLARERLTPSPLRAVPGFTGIRELEHRVEHVLDAAPVGGRGGGAHRRPPSLIPVLAVGLVALMAVPRLAPRDAPLDLWAERYGITTTLAGEILAAAEREGIEPGLAFGLVAEESAFDADRIRVRGAVGLTQILPSTAHRVEPGLSPDDLRDNPVNLRVGFRYLRSQIEREQGSLVDGLLSYALGPGRMNDLRARGDPVPLGYATRVLAHLN